MNSHLRAAVRNLWLGRADSLAETLTGYGVDEHRAAALTTWVTLNAKEHGGKLSVCLRECNELVAFGQKDTTLPFESLEEIRDPHFSVFAIAITNLAIELFHSDGNLFDTGQFWSETTQLIIRQYPVAWAEGMMDVDLTLADMTAKERQALQAATNAARGAVRGLQRFITDHLKTDDPARTYAATIAPRVNIWINGYGAVANRAAVMAGKDQKMEWRIGPTDVNCTSCLKLDGKVKRASWWVDNQVLPRQPNSPVLVCKGYNCLCSLNPTDKPLSRGRMPRLP